MENTHTNHNSATIITGRGTRLDYVNLYEPKGFEGGRPMYSASIIIPKDDSRTLELILNAIAAAYENGSYKLRVNGCDVLPLTEIKLPLIDGDKKYPDDPAYHNAYYINVKNRQQPGLFDVDGTQCRDDRGALYSGCYARCRIQFYVYNKGVNKGIACLLLGVHKAMDGEPLGEPLGVSVTTFDDFKRDEEDADFLN